MSLTYLITILKGSQTQFSRFSRIVEYAVMFYLLVAAVWSLCWMVGTIFNMWGVA